MRWILLVSLLFQVAPAQSLRERIDAALESSLGAKGAFWGVQVVSLGNGRTLYEHNPNRFFTPASNTKLFTTALALMRLGPDYRFATTVQAPAAPDAAGRITELRLIGGGDPMLSARVAPYQKSANGGNPLQPIALLAEKVYEAGVRRVDGDVVGDDTAYVWAPYPDGWAIEDATSSDGAPVSALAINDNVFTLALRAGKTNTPALILTPSIEFYSIDNRVRTGPGLENKVFAERLPGTRQLRIWGTLSSGATSMLLAIDDPALYAAQALTDALTRLGVVVAGRPTALHRFPNQGIGAPLREGVELARRESPPLVELLQIIDKVSQNLHAEMMLREVARTRRASGSREDGLAEEKLFLTEAGVGAGEVNLKDGSGLSHDGLVTPAALVKLLQFMYRGPHREAWISLLPIGGEDGTLSWRFRGKPQARRIHAKTGSLSHVAALSGYVESRSHGWLAFSILANNFNSNGSDIRAVIDRIALTLTE